MVSYQHLGALFLSQLRCLLPTSARGPHPLRHLKGLHGSSLRLSPLLPPHGSCPVCAKPLSPSASLLCCFCPGETPSKGPRLQPGLATHPHGQPEWPLTAGMLLPCFWGLKSRLFSVTLLDLPPSLPSLCPPPQPPTRLLTCLVIFLLPKPQAWLGPRLHSAHACLCMPDHHPPR